MTNNNRIETVVREPDQIGLPVELGIMKYRLAKINPRGSHVSIATSAKNVTWVLDDNSPTRTAKGACVMITTLSSESTCCCDRGITTVCCCY